LGYAFPSKVFEGDSLEWVPDTLVVSETETGVVDAVLRVSSIGVGLDMLIAPIITAATTIKMMTIVNFDFMIQFSNLIIINIYGTTSLLNIH